MADAWSGWYDKGLKYARVRRVVHSPTWCGFGITNRVIVEGWVGSTDGEKEAMLMLRLIVIFTRDYLSLQSSRLDTMVAI